MISLGWFHPCSYLFRFASTLPILRTFFTMSYTSSKRTIFLSVKPGEANYSGDSWTLYLKRSMNTLLMCLMNLVSSRNLISPLTLFLYRKAVIALEESKIRKRMIRLYVYVSPFWMF